MDNPDDLRPRVDPTDSVAPGSAAGEESAPADPAPSLRAPQPETTSSGPGPSGKRSKLTAAEISASTCPYLVSAAGPWRGTKPSSSHQCAAQGGPAPLSRDQQRAFCLSDEFGRCPVFQGLQPDQQVGAAPGSAGAGRDASAAATADALAGASRTGRWNLRSTAPIVLEGPPAALDPRVIIRNRRLGALALVLLMVVAFGLVAVARLPGLLPGGVGSAPSGSGSATPIPSNEAPSAAPTTTSPTPAPSPAVTPTGSVEAATATPRPTATLPPTPQPTATPQTYTVQRGDTLSSIARQFDTTVDALVAANGISDPSIIRIGQTLVIP